MTITPHPLPAAVGRAERALRARLLDILGGSPLRRPEEWIALNLVAGRTPSDDAVGAVGGSAAIAREEAVPLLDDLVHRGLLTGGAGGYGLSDDGSALLATLRPRVAGTTRRLLDGLAPQDVAVAVRVLDEVSSRAEQERAGLGG